MTPLFLPAIPSAQLPSPIACPDVVLQALALATDIRSAASAAFGAHQLDVRPAR